ncbi:MAG: alpha/beta fold hydrolase [Phycisphaerales bacterium JB052]
MPASTICSRFARACSPLILASTLLLGACASVQTPAAASDTALQPDRYDARLTGVTYPFPVKAYRFESQQQPLEMAYMDLRPDQPNGQAVLLLHGKNFSGSSWERTAKDLLADGYRVIIPDQIGFGKSSKPEHYQFSFSALATNTNNLLDEIGADKITVVGHSMGGMVASRFTLMFPERTEKLILVNPIGLEDWQHVVPYLTIDQWYANELKKTPDGVRNYMRASYYDGNWAPEYEELAKLQMNWTQSPDKERLAWVSALTYDMIFTQPVIHDFDQIRVPTLLIIGTRDRTALGKNLVSPEARATLGRYERLGKNAQSLIPNAQLVELDGIGHIPQVEAYDAYISAMRRFLAE